MVKITTTEGLEIILENEFPCVLNHISKPKIKLVPDSITGGMITNMETTVDKILYSTTKINLDSDEPIHANAIYDIRESPDYVADELLKENIEFTAYNLE